MTERKQDYIFLLVLALVCLVMTWPMTIDGLSPVAGDKMADIGASHQYSEWAKAHAKPWYDTNYELIVVGAGIFLIGITVLTDYAIWRLRGR